MIRQVLVVRAEGVRSYELTGRGASKERRSSLRRNLPPLSPGETEQADDADPGQRKAAWFGDSRRRWRVKNGRLPDLQRGIASYELQTPSAIRKRQAGQVGSVAADTRKSSIVCI